MLPAKHFARLRLPVIGAPLFLISNPDLVIAQCKAGIVGAFPSLNARPVSVNFVANGVAARNSVKSASERSIPSNRSHSWPGRMPMSERNWS